MERPGYFGILPANVRYDKNLKPMSKILYTELTALANKNGYCNATNNYFANLYDVSKNTVSLWISELEKANYIKTELIYESETKNIKERRIYIIEPITKNNDTYHEKDEEGITKNNDSPITKKREDNNTSINNTRINNNKEKNIKKEKSQTEALTDYVDTLDLELEKKEIFKRWILYKKDNKQYKNTMSIDSLIKKWGCYSSVDLKEIVENSISNGYQGLFELKNKSNQTQKKEEKTERKIIKNNLSDFDFLGGD